MMPISCLQPLAGLLFFLLLPLPALPQEAVESDSYSEDEAPEATVQLQKIRVGGGELSSAPSEKEGRWTIDRRQIESYGQGGGQVTPLLTNVPNVHFANDRFSDDSLVELRPPSVSIAGGRMYDNNFTLDGFSVNSRFDPGKGSGLGSEPPRHDQGLFLDLSLIDSVQVWQSNVPAEYGRFLGGVIDMRTIRHGPVPMSHVSARRTQTDLVRTRLFQLPEELATPGRDQVPLVKPDFWRTRYTATHSRPVGEHSGIVVSAALAQSSTPMLVVNKSEQKRQDNLNLFLKHSTLLFGQVESDTSLIWAPFEQRLYLPTYLDSEQSFTGGGITLSNTLSVTTDAGRQISFDNSLLTRESNREGPTNGFSWAVTASRPWGAGVETGLSQVGGTGSLERFEQGFVSKFKISEPLGHVTGAAVKLDYGTEVIYSRVGYERPETSHQYGSALVNPDIQCRGRTLDCVENEQYFTRRQVYDADRVEVDLFESGLFAETTLIWPRFEAAIGLRGDYNNYTRNYDVGPRSRFSVDLTGDRSSLLVFGANRYYGGSLITYKLREAKRPYYEELRGATQNIVNDWERASKQGDDIYRSRHLKTPFSDELTLGLRQQLWGGVASVDLLQRRGRDLFSSETTDFLSDGYRVIMLKNDGRSRYESVSVSWDRRWHWGMHAGFNVTWSENTSSNESYDDNVGDVSGSPYVWYREQRRRSSDLQMLRRDYARSVRGSMRLAQDFGQTLAIGLVVEYEGRYDTLVDNGSVLITAPDGLPEVLPVVSDSTLPRRVLANINVKWTPWPRHRFSVLADIENVANARTYTVRERGRGIEVGRRIWLGLDYAF